MNDNFCKKLASAMNAIEKHSSNKLYLINSDIEKRAIGLYLSFIYADIKAEIVYNPAYMQIIVIADSYVLDICSNKYKQNLFSADTLCIDVTTNGMLHIECVFNGAFRKAGEICE